MQNGMAILEESLAVSYKTKHTLTYNPAIVLLGINQNELKIYVHTKTCTGIFIAALFIVTKIWK